MNFYRFASSALLGMSLYVAPAQAATLSPEDLEVLPQCHALARVQARNLNALATTLVGYRSEIPAQTRETTDLLADNARAAAQHASAKGQAFSLIAMKSFKSFRGYTTVVDAYEQTALQNVLVYGYERNDPAAVKELSDKNLFCEGLLTRYIKTVAPGLELPDPTTYK